MVDDLLLCGERLVVLPFLTSQVISTAHEAQPGIVRTKERLRERLWWPGMDKQVEVAIHNCIVCQAADKSAKTAVTPLQPVPLPERQWQKVAVDIVSPMERAPHDCRFAITLVDYFSKRPEVQFCSEVSTCTVTIFLLSVFSQEGLPRRDCVRQRPSVLFPRIQPVPKGSCHSPLALFRVLPPGKWTCGKIQPRFQELRADSFAGTSTTSPSGRRIPRHLPVHTTRDHGSRPGSVAA